MRTATIICWIVAAAVLVGLAIWFLTGTIFGIGSDKKGTGKLTFNWPFGISIGDIETLTGAYEAVGAHNIGTAGIDSFKIDWVAGDVTITPYSGSEIKITEYAQRDLRDNEKFQVSTSGNTVNIMFRERGYVGMMPQKKLEVLVPGELSKNIKNLSVDSTSGKVSVDDISAVTIKVSTVSGGIKLNNSDSQSLSTSSTSGAITLSSLHTDDIDINSISGSVSVSDAYAKSVDCDTTSGSIDIAGDYDSLKMNSISGRITIDNSASNSVLNAESTSGRLEMSGSFEKVEARSISGAVTIKSVIAPSRLKVDTTSGSINIYVPGDNAITVKHSSTSGRFSSDVPVIMQNGNVQFDISSLSGSANIHEISK